MRYTKTVRMFSLSLLTLIFAVVTHVTIVLALRIWVICEARELIQKNIEISQSAVASGEKRIAYALAIDAINTSLEFMLPMTGEEKRKVIDILKETGKETVASLEI